MDERWTESLSAYLDDELPPDVIRELETRLAEDPDLHAVLEELRAVRQRARSLAPPPVPGDLWDGIAARMTARGDAGQAPVTRLPQRLFMLTLPQLVAAAAALVLVSAVGMWTLRGRVDERALARRGAPAETAPAPVVELAAFDAVRIEGEIAELQSALERGRGTLDPRTVSILETNLALIRQATEDAKKALAADPANRNLQRYFAETVANKIDMMRRAARMAGV